MVVAAIKVSSVIYLTKSSGFWLGKMAANIASFQKSAHYTLLVVFYNDHKDWVRIAAKSYGNAVRHFPLT